MRTLVLILTACFVCTANAADVIVSGGAWSLDHLRFADDDVSQAAAEVSVLFDDRHWDVSVGWGDENDYYGVDTWAYVSAQRVMRFGEILPLDLFAGIGLIARTDGERIDELLPSPVSFSLSAGIDAGRLRVQLRHASNGGLRDPNRGVNWLLVGWSL